jgi:hypothetical protein
MSPRDSSKEHVDPSKPQNLPRIDEPSVKIPLYAGLQPTSTRIVPSISVT